MIELDISNYPRAYNYMNGLKTQSVKPIDLARAMITVGQGSWKDVYNLGIFRIGELLCKALAFSEIDNGNLVMQNRFFSLNQSEKATVSYYFGQGLTKLYAEEYFNIKWLFHVDDYSQQIQYHSNGIANSKTIVGKTKKTAKRPDLIGIEKSNNSHIFEAKGNSGGYDTSVMQHAINQVSQIVTYNGVPPLTRTACYYNLSGSPIKGIIIDPENEGQGININLDEEAAISKYYSFFYENKSNFYASFEIESREKANTPANFKFKFFIR
ncbi:MAG: hypothetical protein H6587_03475 [Flavobacteriales bacterium]|nr:hypothetical protein [Flavobacteriales bacterium]MCB9363609.1 hypothetical protein [Flavobacteriales bacterium]